MNNVSTSKSGIRSTELSRKLELRQKTCWLFKQKVMKAMSSSGNHPMVVDEIYVDGQDEKALERKQIIAVAVERKRKGVSCIYGRLVKTAAWKRFMLDHISPSAAVRIDRWSGYSGLEREFPELVSEKSEKKGRNFPQLHRMIMMFKA